MGHGRSMIELETFTNTSEGQTSVNRINQTVADAIERAATDHPAPFQTLVGANAELVDATRSCMSFEDFETTMRTTLDWHD
jgi:hypothetical protein